jgi:hypothetical protein
VPEILSRMLAEVFGGRTEPISPKEIETERNAAARQRVTQYRSRHEQGSTDANVVPRQRDRNLGAPYSDASPGSASLK